MLKVRSEIQTSWFPDRLQPYNHQQEELACSSGTRTPGAGDLCLARALLTAWVGKKALKITPLLLTLDVVTLMTETLSTLQKGAAQDAEDSRARPFQVSNL